MANWQDLFKAFLTNTNDIANTTTNPVVADVAQGAQNAIPWDKLLPLVFPGNRLVGSGGQPINSETGHTAADDAWWTQARSAPHSWESQPQDYRGLVRNAAANQRSISPIFTPGQGASVALHYNPFQVVPPNPLNDTIGGMFANLLKPKRNLYAGY